MLELLVQDGDTPVMLRFEHSLLSLSKWEAKHKVAFMGKTSKTATQMIDYFQDMLLDDVDRTLIYALDPDQLQALGEYINDSQTASSVPSSPASGDNITITSELIYYWLAALQIPFLPTESWHVNRIMMLVQITNFHQNPDKKKRPDNVVMQDWRQENERRKALFNTTG